MTLDPKRLFRNKRCIYCSKARISAIVVFVGRTMRAACAPGTGLSVMNDSLPAMMSRGVLFAMFSIQVWITRGVPVLKVCDPLQEQDMILTKIYIFRIIKYCSA